MSFTTRCPACGTMFKVVPDQLKISDGWVRCGHCSDVFDAMLNLQSETPQPPAAEPPPPQASTPSSSSSRVVIRRTPIAAPPPSYSTPPAAQPVEAPVPFSRFLVAATPPFDEPNLPVPAQAMPEPVPEVPPPAPYNDPGWSFVDRSGDGEAGGLEPSEGSGDSDLTDVVKGDGDDWDSEWLLSPNSVSRHREAVAQELQSQQLAAVWVRPVARPVDEAFERELDAFAELAKSTNVTPAPETGKIEAVVKAASKVEAPVEEDSDFDDPMWPPSQSDEGADERGFGAEPDVPTFVVQGRREAFWRSPAMRAVLLLVAVGLSAVLALQWASFDRDQIAARHPALEPMLKQLCATTGCSLNAPRRIEAVAIDSSTLTRKLGQFYSFDLVVKNSEPMAVAMPALELSLTDSRDKEIARRVFLPEEMPGTPVTVPANGSLSVSMRLSLSENDLGNMAGYRALVFYP